MFEDTIPGPDPGFEVRGGVKYVKATEDRLEPLRVLGFNDYKYRSTL
jgi:hypothetical protein